MKSLKWWRWFFSAPSIAAISRYSKGRTRENIKLAMKRWFDREPK